ncbi:MAG: NAD(P)H-hydrate epimerase [Ehrlichia sp.]
MVVLNAEQVLFYEKSCGVPVGELVQRAGKAVSDAVIGLFPKQPVTVIAGPGNNGRDGVVAAKILKDLGWPVVLMLYNTTADVCGGVGYSTHLR